MEARAWWFVGPHAVELRREPIGHVGDGEVRVRTVYSGISSGTELLAYRGQLDPAMPLDETIGALGGTFSYPFRYGYSAVGVVTESRAELAEGALVFAFHPHQDAFVVAASDVVELGSIDARQATLFPLVETALQISLDAGPLAGEPVVVFGLGTVGLLTALLLARGGARVVAVEVAPWRRELAQTLGVEAVAADQLEAALDAVEPTGRVPLAVEVSGNPAALAQALGVVAHEGVVLVASWYGTKPVELALGGDFHRRRITLRSSQVSTIPAHLSSRWTPARRRQATLDLLGELPLDALTTHTFAFDDAAAAYAALDTGTPGLMHAALGYS